VSRQVWLILIWVVLLLASCGETEGEQPSKEGFIRQVDSVCRKYNKKIVALDDQYNALLDATRAGNEQAAVVLDQEDAVYAKYIGELEAVEPPQGDEATFQKLIDALADEQRLTRDLAAAAVVPNRGTYDTVLDQLNQAYSRTEGVAAGYGFSSC
jgi:hypothetical protein